MSPLPLATKDNRANMLRAFKASGCAVCLRRYPEVDWSELHIDHIDPRDKSHPVISNGLGRSSMEVIIAELLHCQVLCTDCHRKKHKGNYVPHPQQGVLFNGTGDWR